MKQKTHSGLKKRIKVRKSGTLSVQKSCKRHLLSNKSKGQKAAGKCGLPDRSQGVREGDRAIV